MQQRATTLATRMRCSNDAARSAIGSRQRSCTHPVEAPALAEVRVLVEVQAGAPALAEAQAEAQAQVAAQVAAQVQAAAPARVEARVEAQVLAEVLAAARDNREHTRMKCKRAAYLGLLTTTRRRWRLDGRCRRACGQRINGP